MRIVFLKTGLTIPVLRMLGNSPKLENELKNWARIGDIICEQLLSIIMGISLALLEDNSFMFYNFYNFFWRGVSQKNTRFFI